MLVPVGPYPAIALRDRFVNLIYRRREVLPRPTHAVQRLVNQLLSPSHRGNVVTHRHMQPRDISFEKKERWSDRAKVFMRASSPKKKVGGSAANGLGVGSGRVGGFAGER